MSEEASKWVRLTASPPAVLPSEAQGIVEQRQAVLTLRIWEEIKTVVYAIQF